MRKEAFMREARRSSIKGALTAGVAFCAVGAALLASSSASATTVVTASNTILALDGETLKTIATVPVGAFVEEFAATRDGSRVFLATSHGVLALDPSTWTLSQPITDRPVQSMELSADGTSLFVLDYQVKSLSATQRSPEDYRAITISTADLSIEPFATYDHRVFDLAAPLAGGSLFTLEKDAGELLEMTKGANVAISTVSLAPGGDKTNGMFLRLLLDPTRGRLLLPQLGEPGKIWVIDGRSHAVQSFEFPKAGLPVRGAALSRDGSRLYLSALQSIYALDAETGRTLGAATLEGAFQQVAVSPDGASLFVTAPVYGKGGGVAKLRASDLSVEKVVELSEISPYAIITLDR